MLVRYRRASHAVWRYSHDSVLVLAAPDQDVVALTGTAEDLWQLLWEPLTVAEAGHSLAAAYAGPAAEIAKDIAPVLDDLVERGVVDRVTSP